MNPVDERATGERDTVEGGPTYDESEWPIFVVRFPPRLLSDSAFVSHLEEVGRAFRRGVPFGMLIVMGQHPPLAPEQRRASAQAMSADCARYPWLQRGLAIVIQSGIECGVVTAVSWIARPPFPLAVFESEASAKAWLGRQLAGPNASRWNASTSRGYGAMILSPGK